MLDHLIYLKQLSFSLKCCEAVQSRKEIAQSFLEQTLNEDKKQSVSAAASFDQLLKALKEEENFMLED